jgi:uncharacterized protein
MPEVLEATMKRASIILAICLAMASVCSAQQNPADAPASKEDIQRYLETMHSRDLLQKTMDAVTLQMRKVVHEFVEKQEGLPADFEARMDRMVGDMFKDFPYDEYIQDVIPVYQKYLTKKDVESLIAFYSTSTGQKILLQMPAMTADAMQAATPIYKRMMDKAMTRVQEEVELAKKDAGSDSSKKPQQN